MASFGVNGKCRRQIRRTFGVSLISTFIVALTAFAAFPIPADVPTSYVITAAILSGYAINDITNRGVTTLQAKGASTP